MCDFFYQYQCPNSDPKTINLGVNHDKRSAFLDFNDERDLKVAKQLLADTYDIFALSYRPSVAERFGLLPAQIHTLNPNGMGCLSVN